MTSILLPLLADAPSGTNLWVSAGVVAAGLAGFAALVVLHVLSAGPGKRPSLGDTFSWGLSLLWALPVLGVLALVAGRAAPSFQEPDRSPAEVPESAQVQLNDSDSIPLDEKSDKGSDAGDAKAASTLPEWARTPVTTDGEKTLVVVSSRKHATESDAEKEVFALAAAKVRGDFELSNPTTIDWTVPASAVKFRLAFTEKLTSQVGNATITVFRVHRQLELSPETRQAAKAAWRSVVVERRLWGLGGVLGTATLAIAATAMYLRLDAHTHGTCRGRLKAATVATIVAGGLLASTLV